MPTIRRILGGPPQPICPITGEELQVKFLLDSTENSLKHEKNGRPVRTRTADLYRVNLLCGLGTDEIE